MRTAILVGLLVACGGAREAPPPNIAAPAPPIDLSYCPQIRPSPWSHELFAACPPYAYQWSTPWCAGGGCAKPCTRDGGGFHGTMGEISDHPTTTTVQYDAHGRWVSETRDGKPVVSCTYRDDRGEQIDHCTERSRAMHADRDAHGRIIAIWRDDDRTDVTWDAAGRVGAIADEVFVYDARGWITHDAGYVLERDARGRVTRATDASQPDASDGTPGAPTIVYTYDGDHLVHIDGPGGDNRNIAYDTRGRMIHADLGGLEKHQQVDVTYDCP